MSSFIRDKNVRLVHQNIIATIVYDGRVNGYLVLRKVCRLDFVAGTDGPVLAEVHLHGDVTSWQGLLQGVQALY